MSKIDAGAHKLLADGTNELAQFRAGVPHDACNYDNCHHVIWLTNSLAPAGSLFRHQMMYDGMQGRLCGTRRDQTVVCSAPMLFSRLQLLPTPGCWPIAAAVRCLSTGQSFSMHRSITQQDVDTFVHLTGDSNPIHSDQGIRQQHPDQQAANTAIVPGMMMASMFPAIIGSKFPGALYLSQTLKFRQPAVVGTSVQATVTVAKQSGSRVSFDTVCQDSNGRILVDGSAVALIKLTAGNQAHVPAEATAVVS